MIMLEKNDNAKTIQSIQSIEWTWAPIPPSCPPHTQRKSDSLSWAPKWSNIFKGGYAHFNMHIFHF